MSASIKQEIIEQIDKMPIELQKQVLDFAHALVLSEPKGVPGRELLKFVGIMTPEEAEEMAKAIEEGCEQIDYTKWQKSLWTDKSVTEISKNAMQFRKNEEDR